VPVTGFFPGAERMRNHFAWLPASVLFWDFVPQSLQLIVNLNFPLPDFDFAVIVTV
jgi:hypothetical protein